MAQDAVSLAAAAMSRRAHAALTPAERSARARKAALARWSKPRKRSKKAA